MKFIDVFSKRMAEELKNKGHKPFKIRPNLKTPHYDVYVFRNTEELKRDMTRITKVI
ncbi:hypothetical protein [Priestia aryabhattai]|uniref:hypothetical protein n=1 Tax=Priestia aryabhattai TaxID=412384 RepID=UPI00159BEF1A|nr:hypothetical protein [Priestia aryabhattai]